jgi:hypothetical protein
MLNSIIDKVFRKKVKPKSNMDRLLDAIGKHTCSGDYSEDCKRCKYDSLKIGGFSDDCIELMLAKYVEIHNAATVSKGKPNPCKGMDMENYHA